VSDLNALVTGSIGMIAIVLALCVIALVVAFVLVSRRAAALERRVDSITRGQDGRDLGAVLEAHLDKVYAVSRRQDQLDGRAAGLEAQARRSVSGVGLVRYNTFEDMGGNQSFAIALTDVDGYGIVLSSLHARNQTRVYAKAVIGGAPEGALSAEEAEALRLALVRAQGR
jgi:FlaG/FlaF family flagellin (archaellin)